MRDLKKERREVNNTVRVVEDMCGMAAYGVIVIVISLYTITKEVSLLAVGAFRSYRDSREDRDIERKDELNR